MRACRTDPVRFKTFGNDAYENAANSAEIAFLEAQAA